MVLMSLRRRSRIKASIVLTRADHLFINNYIILLLHNILRPPDAYPTELHGQFLIYIYIYIYI